MKTRILAGALLAVVAAGANAQVGSLTSISTPYTQSFDALPSTGNAAATGNLTTGNLGSSFGATLDGWYINRNAPAITGLAADTGTSSGGAHYSYGSAGSTDRALGTVGSGTASTLASGFRFTNNTSAAINTIYFDFVLEQWKSHSVTGTATPPEGLAISYRFVPVGESDADFQASLLTDALWTTQKLSTAYYNGSTGFSGGATPVNGIQYGAAGSFIPSPISSAATSAALDGNLEANRRKVESFILLGRDNTLDGGSASETLAVGSQLAIRFVDLNSGGTDAGNGIDNFQVVPEPASFAVLGLGAAALLRRRKKNS